MNVCVWYLLPFLYQIYMILQYSLSNVINSMFMCFLIQYLLPWLWAHKKIQYGSVCHIIFSHKLRIRIVSSQKLKRKHFASLSLYGESHEISNRVNNDYYWLKGIWSILYCDIKQMASRPTVSGIGYIRIDFSFK